ncbi:DEAD/DEAH box helicase [Leucobacter denitrificans]|uniref:DEAD/DEAH box helicase n=1 Tax=Leucobacter denitrificans TaxID=683042 RepID=UPI001FE8BF9C|nr:AAA domain-containing protein [Leucobacter denitrificans]
MTSGAQSVVEFAEASEQLRSHLPEVNLEGQRRLDAIADYNRYDCVSTLRLRDWLLEIAKEHAVEPFPIDTVDRAEDPPIELSAIGAELLGLAEMAEEPAARTALKLASSAIDYHSREQKSFWWAHYARLTDPIEDWADTRDVVVIEPDVSYVEEDWHKPYRARSEKRTVRLVGTIAPGSSLKPGTQVFAMYDLPAPFPHRSEPGARASRQVRIVDRHDDGVTIEESLGQALERFDTLPIALTPGPPPNAGQQKPAIEHWGRQLAAATASATRFKDPVYELLTRSKPVLSGGESLVDPQSGQALRTGGDEDHRVIGAVTSTLLDLEHSSLAVQGPPGTGKTYLAARVIRKLVESHGWRIGVVAQSHKVVENVLEAVVRAGLDPSRVAKVPQSGKLDEDAPAPSYTVLRANGHARFLYEHEGVGAVIGGTAWDFAHPDRIARRSLDLLVIDEAGQFSLAPTIAASVSAKRLLLLGDQQQLPQVSQGAHPEPVNMSALSWLLGEHETMPDGYGYFLADTRRMHPALSAVVSELSYEHRLRSHQSTRLREVEVESGESPEPGLHWIPVEHTGNATSSPEEAAEIVNTVRRLLGGGLKLRQKNQAGTVVSSRPIEAGDIIVVAAYNAQVECVSDALRAAGFGDIRVGTVDRFQGQEAVFSLVSLAASSAEDVPRGLEFLLMRNRLNVAISRAQWASYLFSSPRLGDGLPTSAEGLSALSGYLRLTERG